MSDLPDLIPSKRAAEIIGRRHEWLCRLRKDGGGPVWYEIEGRIYYTLADIQAWIRSCRRGDIKITNQGATP